MCIAGCTPSNPSGESTPACSTTGTCPPTPDIEITDHTGTVLTGTQNRMVGQQIQLRVRSTPAGSALTNIRWTIAAQTVKSYSQTIGTGTKTDLAAADLQNDSITFYWISGTFAGESKTVSVTATVGGASKTKSLTFTVFRPRMDRFTIVTAEVAVTTAHFVYTPNPAMANYHAAPPPVAYGSQWDAQVTAPAAGDGQIGFTQKILVNRTKTNNGGTARNFSSGGVFVLDNGLGIQYNGPQPIAASGLATLNGPSYADSPGTPLVATDQSASVSERFELYLMYRPTGANSIWVTLGKGTWAWAGQTTRIGAPASTTNTWNAATGTSSPTTSNGSDSTTLPEWTSNFTSITWV